MVEVGAWKGFTTHALLSTGAKVIAVDHFKGNASEKIFFDDMKKGKEDVFDEFIKNVGHFINLSVLKMDSLEAAKLIKDESVDLVFLDGDHAYNSIMSDIVAWMPKVKPGGILCGHDILQNGVPQALFDSRIMVTTYTNTTVWMWRKPKAPDAEKVEVAPCTP